MAIDQFMDQERWPINRLESAVIQMLWKAVIRPGEQERQDLVDVCEALKVRAKMHQQDALERWKGPEYQKNSPAIVARFIGEMQEALIRRQALAHYAIGVLIACHGGTR